MISFLSGINFCNTFVSSPGTTNNMNNDNNCYNSVWSYYNKTNNNNITIALISIVGHMSERMFKKTKSKHKHKKKKKENAPSDTLLPTPTTHTQSHNGIIPGPQSQTLFTSQCTIHCNDTTASDWMWSYLHLLLVPFLYDYDYYMFVVSAIITVQKVAFMSGKLGRHMYVLTSSSVYEYLLVCYEANLITNNLFLSVHTVYHFVETLIGLLQRCCWHCCVLQK